MAARTIQLSSDQLTECVDTIAHKADGNFQYVTFLLDAMARGQRSPDDLEGLPAGLDGLYYESLGRVVKLGSRDWSRDYSPLMGAISGSREPDTHPAPGIHWATRVSCLGVSRGSPAVHWGNSSRRHTGAQRSVIGCIINRSLTFSVIGRWSLRRKHCAIASNSRRATKPSNHADLPVGFS